MVLVGLVGRLEKESCERWLAVVSIAAAHVVGQGQPTGEVLV
jgi:hypothetical protein